MLPETSTPAAGPDRAASGVIALPGGPEIDGPDTDGPETDDALAAHYAWPALRDGAGRPDRDPRFVRANMIGSLDGGTTLHDRSGGLGNAADEHLFALLRDLADVILVGAGTVRAEGYGGVRLSPKRADRRRRWGFGSEPPPIAVVTAGGLAPDLPLFVDTVTPPIVITTEKGAATVPAGVRVIVCGTERLDPAVAIDALAATGLARIHCEGGPRLLASLAVAGLLDECCLTIAPMMLGSLAAPMMPVELRDPLRWDLTSARISGNHLFTRYRRSTR